LDQTIGDDLTTIMDDDYQEIAVPNGKLAEVVTYLEMRAPSVTDSNVEGPWTLEPRPSSDIDWYLNLYRAVGEEWLWYSRLIMPKDKVEAILADPLVDVFALCREGREVGLAELSFNTPGEVEICFFGVAASEIGSGAGRWLMAELLRIAWAKSPNRVWLHTCNFDHPNALPFYLRHGFRAYKRTIGTYTDPRVSGRLAKIADARIPVILPDSGDAPE
jgi:GNAT superfamily N-acetyltransferase